MSEPIVIHRARTNVIGVTLGIDVTGETLLSQVRTEPEHTSTLIMDFEVDVVDAATGELTLTVDDLVTGQITVDQGYMDILRISSGEPLPTFDSPLEVVFQGVVTEVPVP